MTGVLNILKPTGPTSHDVVAAVRRLLGSRRVGHSGTLDPMAEGVLLICVGAATRLVEYLNQLPKEYRAALVFGQTTATQDASGTVLEEKEAGHLTQEMVAAAAEKFQGELSQLPPMYSALKVGGRPLYERARQGETVERQPRRVQIYRLELASFRPGPRPEAEVRIACSSGTYVRTLCHDLGAALGTGATMTALTRTAIGPFRVEQAVSPEELRRRWKAVETLPWIAPAEAVAHLPAVTVDGEQATALRYGQPIALPAPAPEGPLRVLDQEGHLVAIGRALAANGAARVAPEKVFMGSHDPD